jgi:hypothetical protein
MIIAIIALISGFILAFMFHAPGVQQRDRIRDVRDRCRLIHLANEDQRSHLITRGWSLGWTYSSMPTIIWHDQD